MRRLATFCYRRRWLVLALWILAVVAVSVVGRSFGGQYTNSFELPNTESRHAYELLKARFPQSSGDTAEVVFRAPAGLNAPAVKQRIDAVVTELGRVPHVTEVQSPYEQPPRTIAPGGRIGYAIVQLDRPTHELGAKPGDAMLKIMDRARAPGLQVEAGGSPIEQALPHQLPASEAFGLIAAVIILLISFGSVIAMGTPILTALLGLGVGLGSLTLVAAVMDVPKFAPQMAGMIGLGVGIDYALFIVTRYRQELHAGRDPERATVIALDTSGRAVLFAGTTVVISLLGMFLMNLSFVRGLATGE
jgi:RND superfamily putative drug exporter